MPVAPMRLAAAAWPAHAATQATGHDPQSARTKRGLPFAHSTVARRWRRLMLLLLLLAVVPAQAGQPDEPAPAAHDPLRSGPRHVAGLHRRVQGHSLCRAADRRLALAAATACGGMDVSA